MQTGEGERGERPRKRRRQQTKEILDHKANSVHYLNHTDSKAIHKEEFWTRYKVMPIICERE